MKQLLPSKMAERDDSSVRYSSDVGRLRGRVIAPRLHAEPAGETHGPPPQPDHLTPDHREITSVAK